MLFIRNFLVFQLLQTTPGIHLSNYVELYHKGGSRVRLVRQMTKSLFLKKIRYFLWIIEIFKKLAMVFSKKKKKNLQKLIDVMIIENIWSYVRRVVQSAVTNAFNTVRNMALH